MSHDFLTVQLINNQIMKRSDREITPQQCATEVMDTIPQVMQFLRMEMRCHNASDISVPQFRALTFLSRHPGASLSELAEHLGVTRATASAIIDRLVQRSLVDRRERPGERRHVDLNTTQAGADYLQQIRQITRTQIAKMLAPLTETQLRQIVEGLEILGDAVRATGAKSDG